MSSPSRRRETDVMKLMMSAFEVTLDGDSTDGFEVQLDGPKGSPYEGGVWRVRVELPENYPFKSPSIGFLNRIFHPNVDEASGSVCLDVINQTWTPMYDLVNVFEVFLPQLLLYPNPTDPLNSEAAALLLREPAKYKTRVQDSVRQYARGAMMDHGHAPRGGGEAVPEAGEDEDEVLSELSMMSEDEDGGVDLSDDDEPVGKMEM